LLLPELLALSAMKLMVSRRARDHVHKGHGSPLLIFPEGTCVNNEYTVMFQKGAFDMDAVVCPIAIKYVSISQHFPNM
jgi:glycerol-3-phosphate O-acyltransferase 3/4